MSCRTRRWNEAGIDVRVYSSGSVTAQKLFFGHTDVGDLSGFLKGHYDTTTGPKRSHESYTKIAADIDLAPEQILFLSDITAELDAARAAGLQTALSPDRKILRPRKDMAIRSFAILARSRFNRLNGEGEHAHASGEGFSVICTLALAWAWHPWSIRRSFTFIDRYPCHLSPRMS